MTRSAAASRGRAHRRASRSRAVVHVHPQLRREPGRLPLPVADHATSGRPARVGAGRVAWPGAGGSGLRRHEQARASRRSCPAPCRRRGRRRGRGGRGRTARPARAPDRGAARRRSRRRVDRLEAAVGLAGEQVAEPAVGVHLDQRQVVVGRSVQAGQQRIRSRHGPGPAALEEPQRGAEVPVVEFDPPAAQPDQRDLEPGQLGQLLGVQLLVADGQVVAEVDQVAAGRTSGRSPIRSRPPATGW